MADLILHHYPPSPVSEKIRTAFGIKQASWHSVEQNRLPDRPILFQMTGGFRRIPVLQIGADVYCDTQCILMELERRLPTPSFFSNGEQGIAQALSRWTDDPYFQLAVRLAIAPVVDQMPPEFVADRARLYLGPGGDFGKEVKDLPHTLAQFRVHTAWVETCLQGDRDFLFGDKPGYADLLVWFVIWFVQGRYVESKALFESFPATVAWAERMRAIGHGKHTFMTPEESLEIAIAASPETDRDVDANDPLGLSADDPVSVLPLGDSGEAPVHGRLRLLDRTRFALTIDTERCGEVVLNFPRAGYRLARS